MSTVKRTPPIDPVVLADLEAACNSKGVVRDPELYRRITERADPVTVLAHANFPLVVSSLMTEVFVHPIVGIDLAALTPTP